MTESKPEIQPVAQPAAPEKKSPARNAGMPPPPKNAGPAKKKGRLVWVAAFIVIVLVAVAVALAAAVWYQQRLFNTTTTALSSQVQSSTGAANQASEQAQQALSIAQEQSRQLIALQASLHESQARFSSLEQAFQNLTDSGSDLVLINDIDHLVTIASQQLTLSGNVGNAVAALETAQAQLARANRPGLAALQQTINGDLDHLRATSVVDVAALTSRLNELNTLVSQAALLVPDEAAPNAVVAPESAAPAEPQGTAEADPDANAWWRAVHQIETWSDGAWSSIRQDLGRFISVRRANDPSALLMSPDQASQLRENLRLRIMTAQLALMMRQAPIWTNETQILVQALNTRYDTQDAKVRQALKLATQLAQTSIDVPLPTVDNSLQALKALREAHAKAADAKAPAPSAEAGAPNADPAAGAGGAQSTKPRE